ncbi:MAG: T9SS type A sorting domain-containing protein [Candidatus Azobacteroides sp.]|nr:T9SS type A sorting domain-containing protein [Candidatus Azobacteroides sp.]
MKKKNSLLGLMMVFGMLLSSGNLFAQGPLSEICDWPYTPNTGANNVPVTGSDAYVLFSWETVANGNVEISIFPHPLNIAGGTFDYAAFRGNGTGMAANGFRVDGNAVDAYFSVSMSADRKKVILTPKQPIAAGTQITFSGQCEYKTTDDNPTGDGNNLWPTIPNTVFPAYTYGLNCTGVYATNLATPTNVAVVDNILTFDEVSDATGYIVRVYLGATMLQSFTVQETGETINFPFSGNFTVTVTATDDTATYANSDESSSVPWTVSNADQPDLPGSKYCGTTINGNVGSANFSVETDENGDILVKLNGDTYRGNGVNINGFTVAGISGTEVLDKIGSATANPNVFRLKAGITIPKGTLINFNGTIEWTNGGGYGTMQFFTDYIYGTTCSDATKPVIGSASVVGEVKAWGVNVSINATDNIGVTQIKLIDTANGYEQILPALTPNGTGTYLFNELDGSTTYNFSVIAVDLAGNESDPVVLSPYITLATPVITLDPDLLSFSPGSAAQTFTLTGSNVAGPIQLSVPGGYTLSQSSFTPAADGTIAETTVTVTWVTGLGNQIVVSGGGLENPMKVSLTYTSELSPFCSYTITQGGGAALTTPALLNISLSTDKKTLTYTIAPYDVTGDATWNGGALNAERFLVNGVAPAVVPTRNSVDSHTITITFDSPLTDGDVISYTTGATLVWTTSGYTNFGNNGNCFIDAWNQTYTVGENSCDCSDGGTSIEKLHIDQTYGVYPVPVTDVLYISGITGSTAIRISDAQGRTIMTRQTSGNVDVSSLTSGLYILLIDNQAVPFIKK